MSPYFPTRISSRLTGRPMEVLMAEDSLVDARLTIAALQKSGIPHRLTLVCDGLEAVDFLHRRGIFARAPQPDLILLDLELPYRHGLEVLDDVRSDAALCTLPVVVLTSCEDPETKLLCDQHGVDGFLPKPVHLAEFIQLVRQLRKHWKKDVLLPGID